MKRSKKWSTPGISFGINNVLIYVNDMTEGVSSYISICILCKITKNDKKPYCEELQNYYINKIYEWSKTREMEFNAKKAMYWKWGKEQ